MIQTKALIGKFQYALDNDWGYIWGQAGDKWTQKKQDAATREQTKKYGQKWVGHYVADCSGLFSWAFKQLGGYMYNGSDTMYRKYTTHAGELKEGRRTDGGELLPGTAVFVWKPADQKYGHVGLFIGDGWVIEAASTQSGVIRSKVTNKKWTHWGQLKDVNYEGGDQPVPEGYAIVTGTRVALRSAPTTQAGVIMRIDTGKKVQLLEPPPCEWNYVTYNGKTGWMMKKFLEEGDHK